MFRISNQKLIAAAVPAFVALSLLPLNAIAQPVALNPIQVAIADKIMTAPSVVGDWEGGAHSKGDDVVTSLRLRIPANNGAATWQHIGSKQVNGQWQEAVLKEGSLTRSIQANQVKFTLNGFYGKSLQLEGSFQNGGQRITGHQVGKPNYVFYFNKQ